MIVPFERYEILLPLKYNDGTTVEPEKFQVEIWIVAYPIRLL